MKYLPAALILILLLNGNLIAAFTELGHDDGRNIIDDMNELYGAGNWERIDDYGTEVNDQKWTTRLEGDIVIKGKFAGLVHEFGYRDGSTGGEFVSILPEIRNWGALYTPEQQETIGTGYIANDSLNFRFVLKLNDINWKGNTSSYGPRWEWSSDPSQNKGGQDHVVTFRIIDNKGSKYRENKIGLFVIAWEDLDYDGAYWGKSDRDFGDLIIELPGAKPVNFVETNESPLTLANLIACNTIISNYTQVSMSSSRALYQAGSNTQTSLEDIEVDLFSVEYSSAPDSIEILTRTGSITDRTVLRFIGDKELDSLGFHIELIERTGTKATVAVVGYSNINNLTSIELDLFSNELTNPDGTIDITRHIACKEGETPQSTSSTENTPDTNPESSASNADNTIDLTGVNIDPTNNESSNSNANNNESIDESNNQENNTITISGSGTNGSNDSTNDGSLSLTGTGTSGSTLTDTNDSLTLNGSNIDNNNNTTPGSLILGGSTITGIDNNSQMSTQYNDNTQNTNSTISENTDGSLNINGSNIQNNTSTFELITLSQDGLNSAIASIPSPINDNTNGTSGSFNINGYTIDDKYISSKQNNLFTQSTKNLTETFGEDYINSFVAQQNLGQALDTSVAILKNATLISSDTEQDTLILTYNRDISKDIASIQNIYVNGEMIHYTAVANTNNNQIKLVLSENGTIAEETLFIEIKDSASTSLFNDQYTEITTVKTLPRISNKGNGYFDTNHDGAMDRIQVTFVSPITLALLSNATFTFNWINQSGVVEEFITPITHANLDESDPAVLYWNIEEIITPFQNLTSINNALLGSATLQHAYTADGITKIATETIQMKDFMAAVIIDVKLDIGFGSNDSDTLTITLSENINISRVNREDLFQFKSQNEISLITIESMEWLNQSTIQLIVENDQQLIIGDSIRFNTSSLLRDGFIIDLFDNNSIDNDHFMVIEGNPRAIVEKIAFASYDPNDASFTELPVTEQQFVDMYTTASDLKEEGKIGHLIEIGPNTFPQAVADLDNGVYEAKDYSFKYLIHYYTQEGQYVAKTAGLISCDDAGFDGNCLENPNKLFIQWNFKTEGKQNVATGAYIVTMQLIISTPTISSLQQNTDTWGVIRN